MKKFSEIETLFLSLKEEAKKVFEEGYKEEDTSIREVLSQLIQISQKLLIVVKDLNTNAKEELLSKIKNTAKIKCASIDFKGFNRKGEKIALNVNYSEDEYNDFLNSLNFSYDSGYGEQELYGTVWLEDGTWLSRAEYDGSEWWEHNILPAIPSEFIQKATKNI